MGECRVWKLKLDQSDRYRLGMVEGDDLLSVCVLGVGGSRFLIFISLYYYPIYVSSLIYSLISTPCLFV